MGQLKGREESEENRDLGRIKRRQTGKLAGKNEGEGGRKEHGKREKGMDRRREFTFFHV